MRKTLYIVLGAVLAVVILGAVVFAQFMSEKQSLGIIGGADGPTAIFVSGG